VGKHAWSSSGGALSGLAGLLKAGGGPRDDENEPVIIFATVALGRERSSSPGGRPE